MADEPLVTPEYDPNFDTATFYGCRGLNNRNSFTNTSGSNSCRLFGRKQLPLTFLSNSGNCKDVSLQTNTSHKVCFSNSYISSKQNFHLYNKICFSVAESNTIGSKVCNEYSLTPQNDKTSVHCLLHYANNDLFASNKVCKEYGINEQSNYFIQTKSCREYYDFDKTGYNTCFTFVPYFKLININRKAISCGSGEFLIFDNSKSCLTKVKTPKQEHFNIHATGCKVVTDTQIYTGFRPCILHHFNQIIRNYFKNTTCLKLAFNTTKGQKICNKKFSSSVVVSVVFGRVNGGRPPTNIFSRNSGRMFGRISQ